MHAYKDAVRRTVGAYILYPGEVSKTKNGFHELIPGLGAFIIRPSENDTGISEIKKFIRDILETQLSRASQHERLSYHTYDIHKEKPDAYLRESTPELMDNIRAKPPTEEFVLIGYYHMSTVKNQLNWIKENNLYNIRFETISPSMVGAKFILLYNENNLKSGELFRVTSKFPELWSKEKLELHGYPDPSRDEYFVYNITRETAQEFENMVWDVSKLKAFNNLTKNGLPLAVSLFELMDIIVKI
jgi:hypothetical protein